MDQSFLELVRLGVLAPGSTEVTSSLAVTNAQIGVQIPEGKIDRRYNFDGYGDSSRPPAEPWPPARPDCGTRRIGMDLARRFTAG